MTPYPTCSNTCGATAASPTLDRYTSTLGVSGERWARRTYPTGPSARAGDATARMPTRPTRATTVDVRTVRGKLTAGLQTRWRVSQPWPALVQDATSSRSDVQKLSGRYSAGSSHRAVRADRTISRHHTAVRLAGHVS